MALDKYYVGEEFLKWFDSWLALFPRGIRSGGKLIRSDKEKTMLKMLRFFSIYPQYDYDTIFKATKRYLSEQSENDYKYCRCAVYFIDKKWEGSTLAEECENLSLKDNEVLEEYRSDFI